MRHVLPSMPVAPTPRTLREECGTGSSSRLSAPLRHQRHARSSWQSIDSGSRPRAVPAWPHLDGASWRVEGGCSPGSRPSVRAPRSLQQAVLPPNLASHHRSARALLSGCRLPSCTPATRRSAQAHHPRPFRRTPPRPCMDAGRSGRSPPYRLSSPSRSTPFNRLTTARTYTALTCLPWGLGIVSGNSPAFVAMPPCRVPCRTDQPWSSRIRTSSSYVTPCGSGPRSPSRLRGIHVDDITDDSTGRCAPPAITDSSGGRSPSSGRA